MVAAALLNAWSILSCNFISYKKVGDQLVLPDLGPPFYRNATGDVGLWRWSIDDESCEFYEVDKYNPFSSYYNNDGFDGIFGETIDAFLSAASFDPDPWFLAAQSCGSAAFICFLISFFFGSIEFICCRYCGSRFFISFFFFLAAGAQAATFSVYSIDNLWCVPDSAHVQLYAVSHIT